MKKGNGIILRDRSVITGRPGLEHLHTFKDFPVFMGCADALQEKDVRADMVWNICTETGIIQLGELLPLDVLYPEAHGSGCVGSLWTEHHKALAEFIRQYDPVSVLEIGGSHGILAKEYCEAHDIPWTILEPNPVPAAGSTARFIRGFFDGTFSHPDTFDAVVHSHVFEHIYEPDEFMGHLSAFIGEGKHLIFSIPNMQVMMERKFTNCVNFEHTVFLTDPYVEYLLAKHSFRLVQKEYFKDDHSIFYAAVRDNSVRSTKLPHGLYEKNRQLYQAYLDYHRDLISGLNRKIHAARGRVYVFGAHVMSQYLFAFGLDAAAVTCLLDNDPNKHGKRLYGTALKVCSPKILKDDDAPIVILKAGVFNDEIKKDILENIHPNVTFL